MVVPEKFFDIEFNKAMAFGYRTEDVDEFVTKAIEIIKALQEENQELTEKMSVLAESLEKYREDEESLRAALIGAQKLGDSMVREARQKADDILQDANEQAEQILYAARRREENQRAGLEQIKQEVSDFKSRLIEIYRQHIELIRELPTVEEEEEVPEQQEQEAQQVQQTGEEAPLQMPEPEEGIAAAAENEPAALNQSTPEGGKGGQGGQGGQANLSPAGFQISFDRFEDDFKPEQKESVSDAAQRISSSSRYEKPSSDPYAGMKKDSSKFGPLKFGAGYEVTRDEHKKKR